MAQFAGPPLRLGPNSTCTNISSKHQHLGHYHLNNARSRMYFKPIRNDYSTMPWYKVVYGYVYDCKSICIPHFILFCPLSAQLGTCSHHLKSRHFKPLQSCQSPLILAKLTRVNESYSFEHLNILAIQYVCD